MEFCIFSDMVLCNNMYFNEVINMEMIIHLHPDVFSIVKDGRKDVEIRVNDEKRRKLKIGDDLIFLKRPDNIESIKAKVIDLKYFKNFSEVVDNFEMERIYLKDYSKDDYLSEMRRFYTDEEQKECGVVAIIFERL